MRAGSELVTSSLLTAIGVHVHRLSTAQHPASLCMPRTASGESVPDLVVQRAIEILHERLAERLTLEELAQSLGYSSWHLARMFKEYTGLPPHRYQLLLRVRHSLAMLTTRPWRPVADIAAELGFADESHYRRHFKRFMGVTPTQYRQAQ
ncbi:MAG: AraC family transcriptional regulator [Pseudomonadota bacterium]